MDENKPRIQEDIPEEDKAVLRLIKKDGIHENNPCILRKIVYKGIKTTVNKDYGYDSNEKRSGCS